MWSKIKIRAAISTKLTLLYTLILFCILLFTGLLTHIGIRYYLFLDAKKDLDISINSVKQSLAEGNPLTPSMLEENLLVPGVILKVYDGQGHLLWDSAPHDPVNQELSKDSGSPQLSFFQWLNTNEHYTTEDVFWTDNLMYRLQFIRKTLIEAHFLNVLTRNLVAANIIGLCVAIVSGIFISRKILQPIRKIIETTKNIQINNLGKRLDDNNCEDELQELTETINHMLNRIQTGVEQQQRFVADASHELRTPVTVISGYANMLDRWGKNDVSVLDEGITAIKSEAAQMQNLIEKLLYLARIDQDIQILKKAPVEMNGLIDEVVQETRLIAPEHQILLCQNDAAVVRVDPFSIKQLLRIFIENSIKYTPVGGKISICSHKTSTQLEITVQDTGIGIPEEDQPKIFDRFYTVDKSRSKSTGGTGLGLSIARWIAEQHSSTIHVTSKPGKGTTLTLAVPLTPPLG
jgi:signal transduction histidine kinase